MNALSEERVEKALKDLTWMFHALHPSVETVRSMIEDWKRLRAQEKRLQDEGVLLDAEASAALAELLENPPPPSEGLKKLIRAVHAAEDEDQKQDEVTRLRAENEALRKVAEAARRVIRHEAEGPLEGDMTALAGTLADWQTVIKGGEVRDYCNAHASAKHERKAKP